jgi:hypothetical protein
LPGKAPRVDAIGRKLEALGLGEPMNTPGNGSIIDPAASSTPAR